MTGGAAGEGRARHLVLVGMMGTGKTTVGTLVAARLGRPFLDSDRMIEVQEHQTVREIWHARGEPAYRALETDVLREALAATEPAVIAAAGGVVLGEANRRALESPNVCTVRLVAPAEVLVQRVAHQMHRPLLDGDRLTELRKLMTEREALYAEVADTTINVAGRKVEDIADDVVAALDHVAEAGLK